MWTVGFTKKIFLSLLFLLILLTVISCSSASNHFGVIFTINYLDIYRIPDNTQNKVEQLTFTPTIGEYGWLVSENGDRIVFETAFYANSGMKPSELAIEKLRHIYLLDTNSKKLLDITNVLEEKSAQVGPEFFMDWSPDEKQFAVVKHEVVGSEIKSFLELMDFDGKNRRDILIPTTGEIPSLINGVKWSPDEKKFALTQGVIGVEQQQQYPGSAILMYDLDNGKIIQITDYQDHCLPQEWSPTSQQIVVTCSYVPPYSVVLGNSGPEMVRIFNVEKPGQPYEHIAFSPCYDPSWSPDGKQIVFVCDKETEKAGLFIVSSNGNDIHEVNLGDLGSPAILKDPTWSPDGTQIVYVAGSDYEHTKIYSINLENSNNRPLTEQEAYYNIVSVYPLP